MRKQGLSYMYTIYTYLPKDMQLHNYFFELLIICKVTLFYSQNDSDVPSLCHGLCGEIFNTGIF